MVNLHFCHCASLHFTAKVQPKNHSLSQRYESILMKYAFLFLVFLSEISVSQECIKFSEKLEEAVKGHETLVRGGEYCEARERYSNNEREFVLYTIEGPCFHENFTPGSCGNVTYTYLSGILNGKLLVPVEVGIRGTYLANSMLVSENSIIIDGLEYAESDAKCCPSIPKRKVLNISELELTN